jgi:hypothetical protein
VLLSFAHYTFFNQRLCLSSGTAGLICLISLRKVKANAAAVCLYRVAARAPKARRPNGFGVRQRIGSCQCAHLQYCSRQYLRLPWRVLIRQTPIVQFAAVQS